MSLADGSEPRLAAVNRATSTEDVVSGKDARTFRAHTGSWEAPFRANWTPSFVSARASLDNKASRREPSPVIFRSVAFAQTAPSPSPCKALLTNTSLPSLSSSSSAMSSMREKALSTSPAKTWARASPTNKAPGPRASSLQAASGGSRSAFNAFVSAVKQAWDHGVVPSADTLARLAAKANSAAACWALLLLCVEKHADKAVSVAASFVVLRHKAEAASAQARANAPLAGPGAFCDEEAAFAAICESARPEAPRDACVIPSLQTRQAAPGPAAQKFEHKNTRVSSAHNSDAMAMASRAAHLKLSCEQSGGSLTLKAPFRRRLKIFSAALLLLARMSASFRACASKPSKKFVEFLSPFNRSKQALAAVMASSFRTRATHASPLATLAACKHVWDRVEA
mmetsp:Transcript_6449/g.18096  ORF Transcript_6449/g.18096 Transcript_6449/m.18096 type:complete len:397 (-) Transcript_6449:61-1251(-)